MPYRRPETKLFVDAEKTTLRAALKLHLNTKARREDCSTPRIYEAKLESTMPEWLDISIDQISEEMVLDKHRDISENKSPATADFAFRIFSAITNYVAELDPNFLNPTDILAENGLWLKKKKVRAKGKHLTNEQIGQVWVAMQTLTRGTRDYLAFLMLTGIEPITASNLTWKNVDLPSALIHLSSHDVPLSSYILANLATRKALSTSELVFTAHHKTEARPIRRRAYGIRQIEHLVGFEVCINDLSHTYHALAEQLANVFPLHTSAQISQAVTDLVLTVGGNAARTFLENRSLPLVEYRQQNHSRDTSIQERR